MQGFQPCDPGSNPGRGVLLLKVIGISLMYKMFGNKTKRESSEILMREHENILKVVEALDRECNLIKRGGGVDEEFFKKVIDFIKDYADKFHHAKEEEILFKEFNKCV